MAYRVKKEFQNLPYLRTALKSGKTVALNGAHKKQVKGTPAAPPREVDVPLATQAEMKELFEAGNRCIERYEQAEIRNLVAEHEVKSPFDEGEGEKADDSSERGKKKK